MALSEKKKHNELLHVSYFYDTILQNKLKFVRYT